MRNYNDPEYKKWRKNIKKRDAFACKWPGCKIKIKLQVHHILPWSEYPGLRYHMNNGITLCKTHHKMITQNETSYAKFFFTLINKKQRNNKDEVE